jgi:hypothetical protein
MLSKDAVSRLVGRLMRASVVVLKIRLFPASKNQFTRIFYDGLIVAAHALAFARDFSISVDNLLLARGMRCVKTLISLQRVHHGFRCDVEADDLTP